MIRYLSKAAFLAAVALVVAVGTVYATVYTAEYFVATSNPTSFSDNGDIQRTKSI